MRRLSVLFMFLLSASLVLAVNDPGHDSLYVLKIGDNITGNINISGNVTATLVQATSRFFGPNLDIRGDGSSAGVANQIIGSSTDLSISASTLILNKAVTGGWVHIGWTGTTTGLNVTGDIQRAGVSVCLANGTNCIGGNNTGNISTISAGNGISVTNPTGPTATVSVNYGDGLTLSGTTLVINNATVCRTDGTGCPSSATSGSGWANTSTLVYGVSNTTNLSFGNTTGSVPLFFVDATNQRIGVGTQAPTEKLTVTGSANITGNIYYGGNLTGYGGDFAERMTVAEPVSVGDVVCLTEGLKIKKCTTRAQTSVAGVVSENPTIIGSGGAPNSVPVGIVGIVKTKTKGPVKQFDLLTTSATTGHTEKATANDFGAIVGKAMEPCERELCEIKVLVGLR